MSIYTKLKLLVKAKSEEPIRQVIKHNDVQIFEQELREAQTLVKRSKLHLASIKADIHILNDSIREREEELKRREQQAFSALDKDEHLAHDIAERIAESENELIELRNKQKDLSASESRVSEKLKAATRIIKSLQNHLVVLRANNSYSVSAHISRDSGSNLSSCISSLNESLENIKERQATNQAFEDAILEIDDSIKENELDKRVKSAGIDTGLNDAEAVLKRLKSVKFGPTEDLAHDISKG